MTHTNEPDNIDNQPSFEHADAVRGHSFLPSTEVLAAIPRLYATERQPFADTVIHLKYFCGAATWHLAELDPDEGIGFGHCNLGDPHTAEWGYVSLSELRGLLVDTPQGIPIVVERDLWWTPTKWRDVSAEGH